jgi:hypothetical protein
MIKEGLIDEREPGKIDEFLSPNMLSLVQNDIFLAESLIKDSGMKECTAEKTKF